MIPINYRLREEIRFEQRGDSSIVISEAPLNVIRVKKEAVEILRRCDGTNTVEQIAHACGMTEERVFRTCEYFNRKSVLQSQPAEGSRDVFPSVTVIIPTKDRREAMAECLESILAQDYPKDKIEVIVVDDGSHDGTAELVRKYPCRLIRNSESRGQSYCRNCAAREAKGEILAFIDSDCVAGNDWLKELVPYFRWEKAGGVGGYVDGYFCDSALGRYEKAFSPLNMGKHLMYDNGTRSTFYAPTCSLLVPKRVYLEMGGINEQMFVGEDVDFCWRMREAGYTLLYSPTGTVKHKHRSFLATMMKRRADYGSSEATLYAFHPEKRKMLQVPPLAALAFLCVAAAILCLSALPLIVASGCLLCETITKIMNIRRTGIHIPLWKVFWSVARNHFSFFYSVSFHVVRYYMVLFIPLGLHFTPSWLLCLYVLLFSSLVDYRLKRPQVMFPVFLIYYFLDHLSYQLGVLWGCVRAGTVRSYRPELVRRTVVYGK